MNEFMTSKRHSKRTVLFPVLFPVLALLLVAACQEPTRPADYRDAFPLPVSKETASLSLPSPSETHALMGQDALDFQRFVRDYHNRGRKALTIRASAGKRGALGAARMRTMLINAGVPEGDIDVVHAGTGNIVTLSFNAYKVTVHECGNFTSKTTPNWTNRRHANYGCATQRNIGLMVQDPGDLKKAQTVTGADGDRAVRTISGYKTGPAAATEATTTAQ